ncbi:type III secretion protein [Endozoicomonas sp. Mp262]|uniref:type III secretion protein n=1 Tax=Endozoicomonas sp. Mp262 TaxID=2919499 RepID=UPI0021E00119
MLDELLRVKNIREKSASEEVTRCKNHLEMTHQQLRDSEQELQDYIAWRCKEEQLLYDNIMNNEIRQHDLDVLKQKIALLREKDAELEQAIEKAKNNVIEAEEQLELAREAHKKARQAVDKFEEFKKVLDEEAAKEAQRIEDIEMEEFTVRPKR